MANLYRFQLQCFHFNMELVKTRKNRSRFTPQPSGKRTTITEHDIFGIFEPLSRHCQLTTKQLVAFDRRCDSKTRNRLTDLYHEQGAWLIRLSEELKFANALFVDEVYQLGEDGEALLRARGIIPAQDWVRASQIGAHSTMPSKIIRVAHDHMASEIAIDIEIGARTAGDISFRTHIDIIKARGNNLQKQTNPLRIPVPPIAGVPKWIEPDALFAIGSRLFAIEADMNTESIERVIQGKIRAYREIAASYIVDDHFGFDNLTVLFVTTNEIHMRNMMKAVSDIAKSGRSKMFAFACRPELSDFRRAPAPTGRMFHQSWKRVGYEDFRFIF
jgi:hypothetical protein